MACSSRATAAGRGGTSPVGFRPACWDVRASTLRPVRRMCCISTSTTVRRPQSGAGPTSAAKCTDQRIAVSTGRRRTPKTCTACLAHTDGSSVTCASIHATPNISTSLATPALSHSIAAQPGVGSVRRSCACMRRRAGRCISIITNSSSTRRIPSACCLAMTAGCSCRTMPVRAGCT